VLKIYGKVAAYKVICGSNFYRIRDGFCWYFPNTVLMPSSGNLLFSLILYPIVTGKAASIIIVYGYCLLTTTILGP